MSEIISSEGGGSSTEATRKPKPQPFAQGIPQPRRAGEEPRASSIYDQSEPVVREESTGGSPSSGMAVTGNAPEFRPAENPFPKSTPSSGTDQPSAAADATLETPAPVRRISELAAMASMSTSSTMRAAEQLRAAAGEKARQLREATEQAEARAAQQARAAAEAQVRAAKQAEAAQQTAAAQQAEAARQTAAAQQAEAARQAEASKQAEAADLARARAKAAEIQARVKAEAAREQALARAKALADIPEAVASPKVAAPAPAPIPARTAAPAAATGGDAALSPSAQLKVDEWKEIAEAVWADASIVLKDLQKESDRYIRENPTRAALTALGVGFVLGVLLKR